MSTDDEMVTIRGVLGDECDYHAVMNAKPDRFRGSDPGVTTTDGGEVILSADRTFYRDPKAPRWSMSIGAEVVDEEDPDEAGHECICGDLHEKLNDYEPFYNFISLDLPSAVRLAHEILRLAEPLSDGSQGY
jgi:hypothetical protein